MVSIDLPYARRTFTNSLHFLTPTCISPDPNMSLLKKDLNILKQLIEKGFGFAFVWICGGWVLLNTLELVALTLIGPIFAIANDIQSPWLEKVKHFLDLYLGLQGKVALLTLFILLLSGVYIGKNVLIMGFRVLEFNFLAKWRHALCVKLMQAYLSAPYHVSQMQTNPRDFIPVMIMHSQNTVLHYAHQFLLLFANLSALLVLVSFLVVRNPWLMLFLLAEFTVLFVVQSRLMHWATQRTSSKLPVIDTNLLRVIQLCTQGYRETRIAQKETAFVDKYAHWSLKDNQVQKWVSLFTQIPANITEILLITLVLSAFGFLVLTANSFNEAMVEISIIAVLGFRFLPFLNRALSAITTIHTFRAQAQSFLDYGKRLQWRESNYAQLLMQDHASHKPLPFRHSIRLQNASFSYPNSPEFALRNIDLSIHKGEFIGITGTSGAGKSTMFHILMGFLVPQTGTLSIDQQKIHAGNLRSWQRLLGYVSQEVFLLDTNLRENIAYGEEAENIDDARVWEVLRMTELEGLMAQMPQGIQTHMTDIQRQLSGGQRQRLSFCRALYHQPQILLLDEATSALDSATEHHITQTLHRLRQQGLTLISIAHRLSTLKHCNRIVYMENSQIAAIGNFQTLLETNAQFARLVTLSTPA